MAAAEGVEEAEAPAAVEVVELQAAVAEEEVVVVAAAEVVELQAAAGAAEEALRPEAVVERPPGAGQPGEPWSAPVESPCASAA